MNPLVSVIMGTYNGSRTISRAVESMLSQTYSNIEIIICDDCSTDGTYDLLQKNYGKEPRVVLCQNVVNSGLSVSLNNCIALSRGLLLARMDDDDISHADRIEKQVAFMMSHDYAVIGSRINYFDESGVYGCSSSFGERSLLDIYKGVCFAHPTVMMRKDAALSVGGYSTDALNRRGQDYDMWCKLYEKGYRGCVMNEVLLDYCESRDSVKRRKFVYRYNRLKKTLLWRRRLRLPWKYDFYAYKHLLVGLIPNSLLLFRRKYKVQENG